MPPSHTDKGNTSHWLDQWKGYTGKMAEYSVDFPSCKFSCSCPIRYSISSMLVRLLLDLQKYKMWIKSRFIKILNCLWWGAKSSLTLNNKGVSRGCFLNTKSLLPLVIFAKIMMITMQNTIMNYCAEIVIVILRRIPIDIFMGFEISIDRSILATFRWFQITGTLSWRIIKYYLLNNTWTQALACHILL